MNDTPETDAAWKEGNAIREWTCRKLERERDEAREDLEFRRGLYKVLEEANNRLIAANQEAVKLARTLKQERDEAREKIERQAERIRHLEAATNHACGTPLSAALRERDELLQWKKGMLLVESQWDEQAVGRLLGLHLGDSIKANIEPKLRQLIRERDEAREERDLARKEINHYREKNDLLPISWDV